MNDNIVPSNRYPGASNAADFQPPTSNPQAAPGRIFPENPALQPQSGDQSLLNTKAEILVSANPADSRQVTVAKDGWGDTLLVILLAVVLLAAGLWLRRRHRQHPADDRLSSEAADGPVAAPTNKLAASPSASAAKSTVVQANKTAKQTAKSAAKPKAKPKKSKSQRKKRARRG